MINSFKKTFFILIAIFAISSNLTFLCAQNTPDVSIKLAPPQKFFKDLLFTLRRVYPDPRAEMTASFMLAPLGYPFFQGVSDTAYPTVCAYIGDNKNISYIAAVKADETSAISTWAEAMNIDSFRDGNMLMLGYNMPASANINQYQDEILKIAKRSENSDLSITIYNVGKILNEYAKPYLSKIPLKLNDIDTLKISAKLEDDGLLLRTKIKAIAQSDFAKQCNIGASTAYKEFQESKFLPENLDYVLLYNINEISNAQKSQEDKNILLPATVSLIKPSGDTGALAYRNGQAIFIFPTAAKLTELEKSLGEVVAKFSNAYKKQSPTKNDVATINTQKIKIGDLDVMLVKIDSRSLESKDFKEIYATIINGLYISSTGKDLFLETLNIIKSGGNKENRFEKYNDYKCNAVLISDIKNVFKSEYNFDISSDNPQPVEIKLTCLRDSLDVEIFADFATIRAIVAIISQTNSDLSSSANRLKQMQEGN